VVSKNRTHRAKSERALQAIYDEIPSIPDCDGRCTDSCGPIAMYAGEWARVKRSFGAAVPKQRSLTCPLLSPTGRCMVYSVRPYICRLWGTTRSMPCHMGCVPERWLSEPEALDIFNRIGALLGTEMDGPLGGAAEVEAFAAAAREMLKLMEGRVTPRPPPTI
jgi:Fe-S-cluster containining protein